MATIQTDEVSFQINFYSQVFPNGLDDVNITRSTDGFTNNIIFDILVKINNVIYLVVIVPFLLYENVN